MLRLHFESEGKGDLEPVKEVDTTDGTARDGNVPAAAKESWSVKWFDDARSLRPEFTRIRASHILGDNVVAT